MNGLRPLLTALAALGASACAPGLGGGARSAIDDAALQAHTAFLASDLLEGRDTGTRGYDLAAAYVETQFTLAGLEPGAEGGGWRQPVVVRRRTLEASAISWNDGAAVRQLRNGEDVAVDAAADAEVESLDLEMVFVGWGVDAPPLGLRYYDGVDVRGKAVVLLEGAPASLPGALRAHYGWIQQKERAAAARGAVAVLTLKTPARERVSPWERARTLRPLPAVGLVEAPAPGDPAPVKATVTLGPRFADELFSRAGRDVAEIYRAAETSSPQGFVLPGRFRLDRRSLHEDAPSTNVVGLLRGADPDLADEHVVVLSHLDHVGVGPAKAGDTVYNGAVDNAGGVAVLLEVARALKAGPAPRRSVLFVATTGEERGLLGSERFAARPPVPFDRIVAAVSVDGLPVFNDFGGIVALGAEHSTLGEASASAARAVGAGHVPDPLPERGNLALSDQYPFLRRGVPVLFPNPARGRPRSGPDGTAEWDDYMANHYHQPTDELRLPIRWDSAERWGEYVRGLIERVATRRPRPAWYEEDPLAAVFAPDAPRRPKPSERAMRTP